MSRLTMILLLAITASGGCQRAYMATAERFGYAKREMLVDRVKAARDEQEEAREQFASALDEFMAKRLREMAYLMGTRGVRIVLEDERTGQKDDFEFPEGLQTFVEHINKNKTPLHADIVQRKLFDEVMGITDAADQRLRYVGANKDAAYLRAEVDAGRAEYAITLPAVTT